MEAKYLELDDDSWNQKICNDENDITMIEIDSTMYQNVVVGKKRIQFTNRLKFTYYELIRWSVSEQQIILYFNNFIITMKLQENEILEFLKQISINIVSELLEINSISTFEEGLKIYNKLICIVSDDEEQCDSQDESQDEIRDEKRDEKQDDTRDESQDKDECWEEINLESRVETVENTLNKNDHIGSSRE